MKKMLSIEQLALIITHSCNLACDHCLRGESENVDMSDEVINKIFSNINHIQYLQIGGGEPLLALETLKKVVDSIKKNGVIVEQCTIVTNGTLYSRKFEDILTNLNKYINTTLNKMPSSISVWFKTSDDIFHREQINKHSSQEKYYKNIKSSTKSKYFCGVVNGARNLLIQGRLDDLTARHEFRRASEIYDGGIVHSCIGEFDCYGPQIVIDAFGNVSSSCDFSYNNIRGKYFLGNVLKTNLRDILCFRSVLVSYNKFENEKMRSKVHHYGLDRY